MPRPWPGDPMTSREIGSSALGHHVYISVKPFGRPKDPHGGKVCRRRKKMPFNIRKCPPKPPLWTRLHLVEIL